MLNVSKAFEELCATKLEGSSNISKSLILKCKNKDLVKFDVWNNKVIIAEIICGDNDANLIPLSIKNIPSFQSWLDRRAIPRDRQMIDLILKNLGRDYEPLEILLLSKGLSLTDQYWVCEKDETIDWEDLNFFDNDFDFELSDNILDSKIQYVTNQFTPESTSTGFLTKVWRKDINGIFLLKGGNLFGLQPISEIMANIIAPYILKDFIKYDLVKFNNKLYSKCYNFLNHSVNMHPVIELRGVRDITDYKNSYEHIIDCLFSVLGDYDACRNFIDRMLIFDYIINNDDRHFNNFSVLQDADTGNYLGFAPIFDNGSSFFCNTLTENIEDKNQMCKPFEIFWEDQVKLIDVVNYQKEIKILMEDFPLITAQFIDILSKYELSFSTERLDKIIGIMWNRLNNLIIE